MTRTQASTVLPVTSNHQLMIQTATKSPEKTPWWDNGGSSDERFESENESADAPDPPMTAGCTAAQIRDNARQIIGPCCPRTDWRLSCCR